MQRLELHGHSVFQLPRMGFWDICRQVSCLSGMCEVTNVPGGADLMSFWWSLMDWEALRWVELQDAPSVGVYVQDTISSCVFSARRGKLLAGSFIKTRKPKPTVILLKKTCVKQLDPRSSDGKKRSKQI